MTRRKDQPFLIVLRQPADVSRERNADGRGRRPAAAEDGSGKLRRGVRCVERKSVVVPGLRALMDDQGGVLRECVARPGRPIRDKGALFLSDRGWASLGSNGVRLFIQHHGRGIVWIIFPAREPEGQSRLSKTSASLPRSRDGILVRSAFFQQATVCSRLSAGAAGPGEGAAAFL